MSNQTVAIIGGGIGGLAAAIALLQRGITARVFERSAEMAEVGAGIQLSANACHVLQQLGVLSELRNLAVAPKRAEFRHFQSGKTLFKAPLGWVHKMVFGAPYLHVHRADLQHALINRLQAIDPRALQLGRDLIGIHQDADAVDVLFADGSRERAALLLGADGVRSKVRAMCFSEVEPEWTGNFAWRALIPVKNLPANILPVQATVYAGPKQHIVLYYLRQQRWLNVVAVQESEFPLSESWMTKTPWETIQHAFEGWHPQVQTIIKALPKNECYRWDLYRRPEMSTWINDRVALLGDAAHATLPFIAQGAAMALEDALVYARALAENSDFSKALIRYETARKHRTGQMQRRADDNGRLYHTDAEHLHSAFANAMADKENYAFMSSIYRYKAGKVNID